MTQTLNIRLQEINNRLHRNLGEVENRIKMKITHTRDSPPHEMKSSPFSLNYGTPLREFNSEETKLLMKGIPPINEWPKFRGEGEYNHLKFIEWIDNLKEDLQLPDTVITSKLNILLTGSANMWYSHKRKNNNSRSWNFWKKEIIEKFSTNLWRRKMQLAFDKDRFNPIEHKVVEWCNRQYKRLEAFEPEISNYHRNAKILYQCSGNIEHAVRSRIHDDCEFSDLVSAMEEVISRTSIGRINNNTSKEKKDKPKMNIDKEKQEKLKQIQFHNCKEFGHYSSQCNKKQKMNVT